jgi:hypothetical protein
MPDPEDDIFQAAVQSEADDDENVAEQQVSESSNDNVVEQLTETDGGQQSDDQEGQHAQTGNLSVALRQEREARKAEKAERERERAEHKALQAMVERVLAQPQATQQVQQPQQAEEPVQLWDDPDKYTQNVARQLLAPIEQRQAQLTFVYSKNEALREFGEERVTAAQSALQEAIQSGRIDAGAARNALSQSIDPVGDMVRWYEQTPEVQRQKMREELLAELQAEQTGSVQQQPAATGQPSNSNLPPSLNRAIGNAGTSPDTLPSEEDIFNSVPAFGKKRKA